MSAPRPPGWYRDPTAPDRARRWNGRSWTADVRPVPPWLGAPSELRTGPHPRIRPPRRPSTHALWMASMTFAVLAMFAMVVVRFPSTSAGPVVADRTFIRAAAEVCSSGQQGIAAIEDGLDRRERLNALVGVVRPMVARLAQVPVKEADRAPVEQWLAAWREFVELGEAEAEALADDDVVAADELERRASRPKAEVDRFALTNGLSPCVFVG